MRETGIGGNVRYRVWRRDTGIGRNVRERVVERDRNRGGGHVKDRVVENEREEYEGMKEKALLCRIETKVGVKERERLGERNGDIRRRE